MREGSGLMALCCSWKGLEGLNGAYLGLWCYAGIWRRELWGLNDLTGDVLGYNGLRRPREGSAAVELPNDMGFGWRLVFGLVGYYSSGRDALGRHDGYFNEGGLSGMESIDDMNVLG